jgi:hypothetical protein
MSKQNPTACSKYYSSLSNGVHSRDARMVQHMQFNKYDIHRMEDKNHMDISIHTEKECDILS